MGMTQAADKHCDTLTGAAGRAYEADVSSTKPEGPMRRALALGLLLVAPNLAAAAPQDTWCHAHVSGGAFPVTIDFKVQGGGHTNLYATPVYVNLSVPFRLREDAGKGV